MYNEMKVLNEKLAHWLKITHFHWYDPSEYHIHGQMYFQDKDGNVSSSPGVAIETPVATPPLAVEAYIEICGAATP